MKLKIIACLWFVLWSPYIDAATRTVTWTNPTTNTDGTMIPESGEGSLVRTTVQYGSCTPAKDGIANKLGEMFVTPPLHRLMVSLVVVQEFCLQAFASNTLATTFAPCVGAPDSPTCPAGNSVLSNVAVTTVGQLKVVQPTAYTINTTDGAVTYIEVGSVPLGTVCDDSSMAKPFGSSQMLFHVPESKVMFLPDITAIVTVAVCSED